MNAFKCFFGSTIGLIVTLSVAALGVYLLWNHSGHVWAAAPYLLFLLCPLMRIFGHGHSPRQPSEEALTVDNRTPAAAVARRRGIIHLSPIIAAVAMAFSSVSVVGNVLRLSRVRL